MTWLTSAVLAWAIATPEFDWLKGVLERPYAGVSVQRNVQGASNGQFVYSHTLQLKASETLQLSGTFGTELIINGVPYRATHNVTAEYLSTQQAVVLRGTLSTFDKLPYDMRFCDFTGKLQMGNDGERPGHFGMRGTLEEGCAGGKLEVELRDKAP